VILCYHSVHDHLPYASVTPEGFSRHLEWLGAHCEVVPLAAIRSRRAGARPIVALTFDDGYQDNFSHALPLLSQHGMQATFFVTAGLVERDQAVMQRFANTLRRCRPDELRPLSWAQVREMQAAGMEIGAHTYSHPNLARLAPAEILEELRRSKEVVEDGIGAPVEAFAYPFGKPRRHVTAAAVEAAAASGYRRAYVLVTRALRPGDPDLRLPRIAVTRDEVETLRQKVTGAWDFLGWWQERAPLWAIGALRPGDAHL
jgi:peptidoglycan/xylan/chitin deacetylase (PgdA/CDA1 family)